MKIFGWIFLWFCFICCSFNVVAQSFSIPSITSYPFPSSLVTAKSGSKIALAINESGIRNIYVADGPGFQLKKITAYNVDDGQELTSISISYDGKWVAFVRGGDHGAYDETTPRNPSSSVQSPKILVTVVPFNGGKTSIISEGDDPVIAPDSKRVAFIKNGEAWISNIEGAPKPERIFYAKGIVHSLSWSTDGKQLLFSCLRKDHSFIGIFSDSLSPIQWIAPSFAIDESPVWSRDSKKIVFARRQAAGGKPDSLTVLHPEPWSIWTADAATGEVKALWKSPLTIRGSVPETEGGYNLHWAANDKIIFVSYEDGWPHIYSVNANGGPATLLTKGNYMLEQIKLTADGNWIVASANTGKDSLDIDRRHVVKISVDKPGPEIVSPGTGIESYPVVTGDGKTILYLCATASRPTVLAAVPFNGGKEQLPGENLIPKDFPASQLILPKQILFKSPDGLTIHAQLFQPKEEGKKHPAILFVHGGPERQMLLGWHYGDYYANTYAVNQYLVSQGFVVLSINYRLGIGYGFEFQNAPNTWWNGAAEYIDVKAAGEWLLHQNNVDPKRIGIYGGSYGGYLTAMSLAKDSKLFAAGVDIHGVHNLTSFYSDTKLEQAPDIALAKELMWKSSPVAWLDGWTSPVLLIHGDDDGNVEFSQSLDLVKRFEKKGFPFESLVIPDETHHWMKHSNIVKVDEAIAEFFIRKFLKN